MLINILPICLCFGTRKVGKGFKKRLEKGYKRKFIFFIADVRQVHHHYKVKPATVVVVAVGVVTVPARDHNHKRRQEAEEEEEEAAQKTGGPLSPGVGKVTGSRTVAPLVAAPAPAKRTPNKLQIHRNQRHRMLRIEPLDTNEVHTPRKITFTGKDGGPLFILHCKRKSTYSCPFFFTKISFYNRYSTRFHFQQ